ncbi:MAG: PAS domain-containing protein [Myxococcaceae bacterium]|jgi:PAS domain S-box-containing protein|nr:PAS domain-containing protein [Myxococcaceae bacterium]
MIRPTPTGAERSFPAEGLIVTKTDARGHITYANPLFIEMAGYPARVVLGAPHSLVRHPDMPRGLFRLAWQTLAAGDEFFAFVKNLCASGDHYWVFAHMTPSHDGQGRLVGYHSNRRFAPRGGVERAEALYASIRAAEVASSASQAAAEGASALGVVLERAGRTWSELMFDWVRS